MQGSEYVNKINFKALQSHWDRCIPSYSNIGIELQSFSALHERSLFTKCQYLLLSRRNVRSVLVPPRQEKRERERNNWEKESRRRRDSGERRREKEEKEKEEAGAALFYFSIWLLIFQQRGRGCIFLMWQDLKFVGRLLCPRLLDWLVLPEVKTGQKITSPLRAWVWIHARLFKKVPIERTYWYHECKK